MNQHHVLFSVFFFYATLGTSASLVGHCYNADDRIIKVSNKFENDMRCECVYCSIEACYSLP